MRHFRPLLLADLDCRTPVLRVRRLSVNRHLLDHLEVESHRHRFHQLLFYLTGQGDQVLDRATHAVSPGTLVVAPAGTPHAFQRASGRPPLCLVIDFAVRDSPAPLVSRVPERSTRAVRSRLHELSGLRGGRDAPEQAQAAAIALWLTGFLLAQARGRERRSRTPDAIAARIQRLLETEDGLRLSIHEIATQVGVQQDHLNRRVKLSTGLTLQQLRAKKRLSTAQRALREGATVTAAADSAGIDDPNYFVRWFKRQAGVTPGQWSRSIS